VVRADSGGTLQALAEAAEEIGDDGRDWPTVNSVLLRGLEKVLSLNPPAGC
jgi:hypothetical protein